MRNLVLRRIRVLPALPGVVLAALAVVAATAGAAPSVAVWHPSFVGSTEATTYPPMAPGPATVLPDFVGSAVAAQPLPSANVPQNPSMGPNPFNSTHDDSWNSDTGDVTAPLGHDPVSFTSTLGMPAVLHQNASTGTFAFDRYGRMIDAYFTGASRSVDIIDPVTLEVLCSYPLGGGGVSALGNCYFFVDDQSRIVLGKGTDQIVTLREGGTLEAPTLEVVPERSYDLSGIIPAADHIAGLLPDWKGRLWFQTAGAGGAGPIVGVIDPAASNRVTSIRLTAGEVIWNSLSVARDGAFVLTSQKLYRVAAGSDGKPRVVWSAPYDTTGTVKSGQYSLGSGTSPTILGGGKYVTIADNAVPMKVVVFRTKDKLARGEKRQLGAIPVFTDLAGQGAENSLTGYRNSIVVENVYGYGWAWDANGDLTSKPQLPGFERIDITKSGKLRKVWENTEVASNTVPRLSTKTGLIYLVERQQDTQNDVAVYYWTALDFRTGKAVWRRLLGTGINYDGYWSTTAFSPQGAFYVACWGGLAGVKDGE